MIEWEELKNNEGVEINKKVETILNELDQGAERKDLVEMFDYSGWKSVDTYMRRKGFRFDTEEGNFVPKKDEQAGLKEPNDKEEEVVALFDEDGLGPAEIADKIGFDDHRELADYMSSRGYSWDSEKENYIKGDNNKIQKKEVINITENNKTVGKVFHLDHNKVKLLNIYSLFTCKKEDSIVETALVEYFKRKKILEDIKSKFT